MSEQEKLTSTTEKDQNLLLPMNMQKLIREPQTFFHNIHSDGLATSCSQAEAEVYALF